VKALREQVVAHWVVAALLCPLVFAAIAPASLRFMPIESFATLALLPIYMAHQVEEHFSDRFRLWVNARAGAEALTPAAVAVINLPGVWGVILAAFLLGGFTHPGWGMVAAYLAMVNALAHVAAAVALRGYNPGLVSAVALLLPAAAIAFAVVPAAPIHHAVGLAVALALHAAIALHVKARARG
jgi:hypothetical protein